MSDSHRNFQQGQAYNLIKFKSEIFVIENLAMLVLELLFEPGEVLDNHPVHHALALWINRSELDLLFFLIFRLF